MSAQQSNFAVQITKKDVKKAIRTSPNEIFPNKIGEYVVNNLKGVGTTLTIVLVPSVGNAKQLVVHRPIGVTPLDNGKDWVLSQSDDLDLLLARVKDPDASKILAKQAQNRTEFLVLHKLLKKVEDAKVYYSGVEDKTRNEYLDEAEKELKRLQKEKKASPDAKRIDFLGGIPREREKAIAELLTTQEAKDAVMKDATPTFQTRGGALDDVIQCAIPGLHNKSVAEVCALLPKMMILGIGRGETTNVTVVETQNVPKGKKPPNEAEIEVMREKLYQLGYLVTAIQGGLANCQSACVHGASVVHSMIGIKDNTIYEPKRDEAEQGFAYISTVIEQLNKLIDNPHSETVGF